MIETLFYAFGALLSPFTLAIIFTGTLFGVIVGALPGLGSVIAVTMVLPFTFTMPQIPSIALLLGVYCGSVYGGSISAILINTPGTPASAATCFDGYPMVRQGKADAALGWATTSSFFGGIFSVIVLMMAAPTLARLALYFGPIEYFALMVFALTCICGVSQGAMAKGLLSGAAGLFLAVVGSDPITGDLRFTFDSFQLSAGIGLIPVIVGVFAFSEVFIRANEFSVDAQTAGLRVGCKLPSWAQWKMRWKVLLKSASIGSFIGVLPGTGAATASFVSYAEAKRSSPNSEHFGTGEPDGIIASEAANNAVTGGALVPTLALGIPGDPVTAIMLGAFILQGITPGPTLFAHHQGVVITLFVALLMVNVVFLLVGIFGSRFFSYILRLPEPLLLGIVIILGVVGAYGVNNNEFDVWVALISGIVGFLMRLINIPVAPLVIGMVLGPMVEQSLRQGLIIVDGDFLQFFHSPIAVVLFVLTILFIWFFMRANRQLTKTIK